MSCPECGDSCSCGRDGVRISARADFPHTTLDERALVDPEAFDTSEQQFEDSLAVYGEARGFVVEQESVRAETGLQAKIANEPATVMAEAKTQTAQGSVTAASLPEAEGRAPETSSTQWRQEVAARLQSFKERRRLRGPKYPSLRLPFEVADAEPSPPPLNEGASRSSLAFELEPTPARVQPEPETVVRTQAPTAATNLIEFPRYAAVPFPDELAEPVVMPPRILEAPEMPAPHPALGGIILEPREVAAAPAERHVPVASLARRISAAVADGILVAAGTAMFSWIALRMMPVAPPLLQLAASRAVSFAVLWMGYQYALLVYSGMTPGLSLTGLELCNSDASPTTRRLRQWRVLASALSLATFGLGYIWAWFDEDRLCWHDRITRTCLCRARDVDRAS